MRAKGGKGVFDRRQGFKKKREYPMCLSAPSSNPTSQRVKKLNRYWF